MSINEWMFSVLFLMLFLRPMNDRAFYKLDRLRLLMMNYTLRIQINIVRLRNNRMIKKYNFDKLALNNFSGKE